MSPRRERLMVPPAEFRSYYGLPILKKPTWKARYIASYLFLGGLAGASSTLAAAAELTGRPALARAGKVAAAGALGGSLYGLVCDLGRPERFVNMLRVFKPSSPMSVGSWLLAGYGPQVVAAAASDVTGLLPVAGKAATLGAGLAGPLLATYTGALVADTAVPVWHGAHRELPFLFAGSAAASAGGLGMVAAPRAQAGPARRAAVLGAVAELVAGRVMEQRLGTVGEPLREGRPGDLMRAGRWLTATGALAGYTLGRRSRTVAVAAGLALLGGSACTRFGIFLAGTPSADDPRHTVGPQRERLSAHPAGSGVDVEGVPAGEADQRQPRPLGEVDGQ